MKKQIIAFALLLFAMNANAQTSQPIRVASGNNVERLNYNEMTSVVMAKSSMVVVVNEFKADFKGIKNFQELSKLEGFNAKELTRNETVLINEILRFVAADSTNEEIFKKYNGQSILDFIKSKESTGPYNPQNAKALPPWKRFWDRVRETFNIIGDAINGFCCNWGRPCCG